ncbi:hypothetical protein J4734_11615 [Klebsiella pneumoniae]|uniref:Uncharacterized protein n=1 Tax=Klebsiella pneumoniae TaxID=573 RepID=A0A939SVK3_KLEPN|nr:hypothetical protein [Klebsiella pneumoniae]
MFRPRSGLMPGGGCALPGSGYGRPVQVQQAGKRRAARQGVQAECPS